MHKRVYARVPTDQREDRCFAVRTGNVSEREREREKRGKERRREREMERESERGREKEIW